MKRPPCAAVLSWAAADRARPRYVRHRTDGSNLAENNVTLRFTTLPPNHDAARQFQIAVADDHPGFRVAVVAWLRQVFGFEVVEAAGTDPAALSTLRVDLLLLGTSVRKLLDLDLVRHVKSNAIASHVIVMSSNPPCQEEEIFLERGADATVHKYALVAELPAVLSKVLDRRASR